MRFCVSRAAGKRPNILFPIFTNGTFMGERYFELFDRCRNLVPIMSIEGEFVRGFEPEAVLVRAAEDYRNVTVSSSGFLDFPPGAAPDSSAA